MELLTRHRWFLAIALAAVTVASCLSSGPSVVAVRFSHAEHLELEGVTCAFCHTPDPASGEMRLIGPQLCVPCHEEQGRGPPDFDVRATFDESGRYLAAEIAELPDELRFRHGPHVAVTDCSTCHGDIAHSDGIPLPTIAKDDCMGCHAEQRASNDCATCHREIDRDWHPPTHDGAWDQRHGFVARAMADEDPQNRCELCHDRQTSCVACHQERMPQDHTNFWRERGHGISSRIDRSRCATCHQPDFCSRCHESTRPRSHSASFGSPSNRHCVGCHFPLQDSGCVTCHRSGAPQHLGVPLPAGHHPAMNCRLCHGAGVRLPHPDPGTSCIACHR